jgi:hypothetical protein
MIPFLGERAPESCVYRVAGAFARRGAHNLCRTRLDRNDAGSVARCRDKKRSHECERGTQECVRHNCSRMFDMGQQKCNPDAPVF